MPDFSPESIERGYEFAVKCLEAKLRGVQHELDVIRETHDAKPRPGHWDSYVMVILQEFRGVDGFDPSWDLKEDKHKHHYERGVGLHQMHTEMLCAVCGQPEKHPDHTFSYNARG